MKNFTNDNTEGAYTQEELNKMNEQYENEISELDENGFNYQDECQNISEKIMQNY